MTKIEEVTIIRKKSDFWDCFVLNLFVFFFSTFISALLFFTICSIVSLWTVGHLLREPTELIPELIPWWIVIDIILSAIILAGAYKEEEDVEETVTIRRGKKNASN